MRGCFIVKACTNVATSRAHTHSAYLKNVSVIYSSSDIAHQQEIDAEIAEAIEEGEIEGSDEEEEEEEEEDGDDGDDEEEEGDAEESLSSNAATAESSSFEELASEPHSRSTSSVKGRKRKCRAAAAVARDKLRLATNVQNKPVRDDSLSFFFVMCAHELLFLRDSLFSVLRVMLMYGGPIFICAFF